MNKDIRNKEDEEDEEEIKKWYKAITSMLPSKMRSIFKLVQSENPELFKENEESKRENIKKGKEVDKINEYIKTAIFEELETMIKNIEADDRIKNRKGK